jgi:AcrR family transcriptional regulator
LNFEPIQKEQIVPRKTKAEAEQTRNTILDAALKVFSQEGYSRTTLEKIAAEAGVTRGAIYWHFKNKAQIHAELVNEVRNVFGERITPILKDRHASLEDLKEGIKACLFYLESDERSRKIIQMALYRTELVEDLKPISTRDRQEVYQFIKDLSSFFKRLKARNQVRKDLDDMIMAIAFNCYVMGIIHSWLFDPDLFSLKKTAMILINTFFEGLY